MTREEAISLVKSAQLMLVNPTTNEPVSDLYEAFDMAIKSLEQEPCDDAVSRQAVMELLNKRYCRKEPYEWKEGNTVYKGYDTYYMINFDKLKVLPSVLPKRDPNNNVKTHYFHNDDYCPKEVR